MITLKEILKNIISEAETYSEYLLTYGDNKQYLTTKYTKVMDYIHDNNIEDYKLEGKKLDKWEVIDGK